MGALVTVDNAVRHDSSRLKISIETNGYLNGFTPAAVPLTAAGVKPPRLKAAVCRLCREIHTVLH